MAKAKLVIYSRWAVTALVWLGCFGSDLCRAQIDGASTDPGGQRPLIRLRETKIKGSQYDCRLVASLEGRGTMHGYTVVEGGAHFFYQTELEWHSEVLENDGVTLVERRHFKTSAGTSMLSVTEFGLTKSGAVLATGGLAKALILAGATTPGAGWTAVAAAELARSDRLLKVPLVGPCVKSQVEQIASQYGPNQVLKFATKTLGNLKDTEIDLTWKNGRLNNYKVITPGVELPPEGVAYATQAAAFLDVNMFPDSGKRVGESWKVPARDVASYINAEPDLTQSVDGVLRLTRAPDAKPEEIAVLNGSGNASFSGQRYSASYEINSMPIQFHYGGVKTEGNQFISDCHMSGTATIEKIESGHMLFGLHVTAQPHCEIVYECVEER